jgi:hypothetical protein
VGIPKITKGSDVQFIHLIKFGNKAFLAMPPRPHAVPNSQPKGWKPHVWTRNIADAEKFSSIEHATIWGNNVLPHRDWKVVSLPVGSTGGNAHA